MAVHVEKRTYSMIKKVNAAVKKIVKKVLIFNKSSKESTDVKNHASADQLKTSTPAPATDFANELNDNSLNEALEARLREMIASSPATLAPA